MLVISGFLVGKGDIQQALPLIEANSSWPSIVMITAVTFVAYEGFQLGALTRSRWQGHTGAGTAG